MCARRNGVTRLDGAAFTGRRGRNARSQRAQIVRHAAEFSQHLRVAEFADHGIAGAAERDRTDAARASRQQFGAPQRGGRALAFLGAACDRRTALVLLARGASAGAQPAATAACNSSSSASRYSFAMISALMVERRLPSHIAIAWSQACS
jgi:hypothetical protein